MNKGYLAAFAAYLFWGLSPIYWKIVASVPALEILCLRVLWAVPFLLIIILTRSDFSSLLAVWYRPWKYRAYLISAFLLATNWYVWIWAVSHGKVVDASLGYFINPLLNVLMGVIFLHEHLRRMQWVSLFLALAGVLYLTINYGHFP
jgi:chloramphenicol-sensitive protein RarD